MEAVLETYRQLSTFEQLELYYMARDAVGIDVTIFVTMVFAYITVAYLVGKKLNRFQVTSVSVLYSLFAIFNLDAIYTETGVVVLVSHLLYGVPVDGIARPGFIALLALVWLFSLFFMYQARRIR